jgi:hypothetical protein
MRILRAYIQGNEADGIFVGYRWELKDAWRTEAQGGYFSTFEEALADCKAKTPVREFEVEDREHPAPVTSPEEIPEGEDVQYVRFILAKGSAEVEGEPTPPRW